VTPNGQKLRSSACDTIARNPSKTPASRHNRLIGAAYLAAIHHARLKSKENAFTISILGERGERANDEVTGQFSPYMGISDCRRGGMGLNRVKEKPA
jgi:hypothetical protein